MSRLENHLIKRCLETIADFNQALDTDSLSVESRKKRKLATQAVEEVVQGLKEKTETFITEGDDESKKKTLVCYNTKDLAQADLHFNASGTSIHFDQFTEQDTDKLPTFSGIAKDPSGNIKIEVKEKNEDKATKLMVTTSGFKEPKYNFNNKPFNRSN